MGLMHPEIVAADAPLLFGLVRVGSLHVALPIAAIREVVPWPMQLMPMPATLPQLRGAIDLRGAIVPVLDLADMIGAMVAPDATPGIILVARVEGRVIGVGVDEICGVVALDGDRRTGLEIRPTGTQTEAELIKAAFCIDSCSGVILDIATLARLPGVPLADDRLVTVRGSGDRVSPVLTVDVGGFRLGLPAQIIEAAVPRIAALPSPVADPFWMARIDYNGAHIPVADPLRVLGLGDCPPVREMACVLLNLGEGRRVGLYIDAVHDLVRIGAAQEAGLQGIAIGTGGIIRGLLEGSPPIVLLDSEALVMQPDLLRLSRLEERQSDANETSQSTRALGEPEPFLIFRLGEGCHAAPLCQVTEILRQDTCAIIPTGGEKGPCAGLFSHRGLAIPILDLAEQLGLSSQEAPRFIVLGTDGARTVGFPIDDLLGVERLHKQPLARPGSGPAKAIPSAVITTRSGVTCVALDLAQLIAVLPPAETPAM